MDPFSSLAVRVSPRVTDKVLEHKRRRQQTSSFGEVLESKEGPLSIDEGSAESLRRTTKVFKRSNERRRGKNEA